MDVVRVRDHGSTLFESCGTAIGTRIVSISNMLTLDLVASKRFYSARGFLLQYQGEEHEIARELEKVENNCALFIWSYYYLCISLYTFCFITYINLSMQLNSIEMTFFWLYEVDSRETKSIAFYKFW